jgi:hypothetical protein
MTKAAIPSAIIVYGLLALTGHANAEKLSGLPSLQGAWVEQSMNCEQVFRPTKRSMAFRRDVSVFAPAFIISGRRITTPGASCTINRISYKAERMILNLGCTTTIATSPVKAYLSVSNDGAVYRYNDDVETAGSKYNSCKP